MRISRSLSFCGGLRVGPLNLIVHTECMWIGEVNVPRELLDSASAGNLVIFVGAGASRDDPSNLPDFRELIEDVGTKALAPPSEQDANQPDVFLGRIADSGVDVHQLVADALNQPTSAPNRLHKAVVNLVGVYGSPRIVTTNYDRHLANAATDSGIALTVFEGPALPIGDDFEGIVYLHGSLGQDAKRLIVTDRDFGRAYLRDAWAARFLERMFATFTVLFIGYSHGDVVMQYLARSLGPAGKRYVLTTSGENADWRSYGLTPIAYPLGADSNHSALPQALERWVQIVSMGYAEHRTRVADLVAMEPPLIPEEVSYLEETIQDQTRIKYFTEKARGSDWFNWVAKQPVFEQLFDRTSEPNETTHALTSWITDHYMVDEMNSPVALRLFGKKAWRPDTWEIITRWLLAYQGPFPDWLTPWLVLTIQNCPDPRSDLLDLLLARTDWDGNLPLAIMLLEHRTQPIIDLPLALDAETALTRFQVGLAGDEYWLSNAWTDIFRPGLDKHSSEILASVDAQITRIYRMLHSVTADFDTQLFSISRSAIEPHEQDNFRTSFDMLIDAARDSVEHAIVHDPQIADRYIQAWSESTDAIFRRLALHGWRIRKDKTPTEKLSWLREREWMWDTLLRHEVFLLFEETVPAASETEARLLVAAAEKGPPRNSEDEISYYESYNLLAWLARIAPGRTLVTEAFDVFQQAHPEFAPRLHPDLNSYITSGVVEDALPLSPDELHDAVSQDPVKALTLLREYRSKTHALTGPMWHGALQSLQSCIAAHPADGVALAKVLLAEDDDFRKWIILGWTSASLDDDLVEKALGIIEGWDKEVVRNVTCAMLSERSGAENSTPWRRYPRARRLATQLWPTLETTGSISGGDDLLMEAINHPAGKLAQFWTNVVQWEWSTHEDSWEGLPDTLAEQLDPLVNGTDRNGLLACTVLASLARFFYAADSQWCIDHLLPLFQWEHDHATAKAVWNGFLHGGQPSAGLLDAGLLDSYIEASRNSDELGTTLERRLAMHLAYIALFSSADPGFWLPRFVSAAPEQLRTSWADQVAIRLTDLSPKESALQWTRWIKAYWSGRNQSIPLPLSSEEASSTACWVLGLPTVRSDAIELVLTSKAGLGNGILTLNRLHKMDLAHEAADWARFLAHLLKNTISQPWGITHDLKDIVQVLRSVDPALDLKDLVNQAMRLGATDASDW